MAADNRWISCGRDIYFVKRYSADWLINEEEPYLFIRMDQDFLYKIKTMASGIGTGGILMLLPDKTSLFSVNEEERALLDQLAARNEKTEFEISVGRDRYQIIKLGIAQNGLELVRYYPIRR